MVRNARGNDGRTVGLREARVQGTGRMTMFRAAFRVFFCTDDETGRKAVLDILIHDFNVVVHKPDDIAEHSGLSGRRRGPAGFRGVLNLLKRSSSKVSHTDRHLRLIRPKPCY